jgi:hypothetical protein
MYSLPTLKELTLTKILAMTHLLEGFLSIKEKMICSKEDGVSETVLLFPSSFSFASFYVNSSTLERFNNNNKPNSSMSPSEA